MVGICLWFPFSFVYAEEREFHFLYLANWSLHTRTTMSTVAASREKEFAIAAGDVLCANTRIIPSSKT